MTRAYDTAATQRNSGGAVNPFVAGKNKIINGDFRIAQRGTSFSIAAQSTYTLDRFITTYSTALPTAWTVSQQTFTPGTAPVADYEGANYLRSAVTNIGTSTFPATAGASIAYAIVAGGAGGPDSVSGGAGGSGKIDIEYWV